MVGREVCAAAEVSGEAEERQVLVGMPLVAG
jgi:hypothetical protein